MRVLLVACLVSIVGCGSSEPTPASVDSGRPTTQDAGSGPGTTGLVCTKDEECSAADAGAESPFCSTSLAGGSLYPTPVCLGMPCDPGDGTSHQHERTPDHVASAG